MLQGSSFQVHDNYFEKSKLFLKLFLLFLFFKILTYIYDNLRFSFYIPKQHNFSEYFELIESLTSS